jgi:hypothetical protein
MEFGLCDHGNFVYMADTAADSPDQSLMFREHVSSWLNKHGIILGEGTVRFIKQGGGGLDGPAGCYDMRAPIIEGPDFLLERIDGASATI